MPPSFKREGTSSEPPSHFLVNQANSSEGRNSAGVPWTHVFTTVYHTLVTSSLMNFRARRRRSSQTSDSETSSSTLSEKRASAKQDAHGVAYSTVFLDINERNAAHWGVFDEKVQAFSDSLIVGWKEEIDTLLVFSGLFSAVVTAFILEAYKDIQPSQSTLLLAQITRQLAQIADTPLDMASTRPPRSSAAVNALWFISLVCGLVAASMGMLVKQWLREYTDVHYSSPRERSIVRQRRYAALSRWRVFQIMALPSVILQFALALFLIGLMCFIGLANLAIFILVLLVVLVWLGIYIFTSVAPTFYSDCPYKSPQARLVRILIHFVARALFKKGPDGGFRASNAWHYEEPEVEETTSETLGLDALINADKLFADDIFLRDTIRPCLRDVSPRTSLQFLTDALSRRLRLPEVPAQLTDVSIILALGDLSATVLTMSVNTMCESAQQAVLALLSNTTYKETALSSEGHWGAEMISFVEEAYIYWRDNSHLDAMRQVRHQVASAMISLLHHPLPDISRRALLFLKDDPTVCEEVEVEGSQENHDQNIRKITLSMPSIINAIGPISEVVDETGDVSRLLGDRPVTSLAVFLAICLRFPIDDLTATTYHRHYNPWDLLKALTHVVAGDAYSYVYGHAHFPLIKKNAQQLYRKLDDKHALNDEIRSAFQYLEVMAAELRLEAWVFR
ncbi:hypothetical protein EIP91_005456 [Steccherinum ochraceum]|uniref:DUF6535 domain-containing protein n=1 Tax=Steccherinum ochraceum TaxID=92696 RepID=A0A4R0RRZ3_9APHY|nr:hypothetical protein EIP91_005456 [Steccherinum ochraceum]